MSLSIPADTATMGIGRPKENKINSTDNNNLLSYYQDMVFRNRGQIMAVRLSEGDENERVDEGEAIVTGNSLHLVISMMYRETIIVDHDV